MKKLVIVGLCQGRNDDGKQVFQVSGVYEGKKYHEVVISALYNFTFDSWYMLEVRNMVIRDHVAYCEVLRHRNI